MFSESSPQRTDIADDEITDTDDSGSTDAADSTILSILSEKTLPTDARIKRWNRIQPGKSLISMKEYVDLESKDSNPYALA